MPSYTRGPGRVPPPSILFEIRSDKSYARPPRLRTGTGDAPWSGPYSPGKYDDDYNWDGIPYAGPIVASRKPPGGMGFLSMFGRGKKKKYVFPSYPDRVRESNRVIELEAEVARFKTLMAETEEKPPTRLPAPSKRKMNLD